MSRYVSLDIEIHDRGCIIETLRGRAIAAQVAPEGEAIMLDGSLECAGEPVEIRVGPGAYGAVEDFGFTRTQTGYRLVCGEHDRKRLEASLLVDLREQTAVEAAQREGLEVERHVENDGTRRLVLRRK